MGRRARAAIATAALLLAALPAHAEGGGHGGAARPALLGAQLRAADRRARVLRAQAAGRLLRRSPPRIQDELKAAADLRAEAEARYAKWQRRLIDLESELAEIRETARERAAAEREHILADAAAGAERIRRDALAAVDQELRRARAQLRQEAADLAVELASETLRRQVTGADQDRLLDEFVATIERAPAAGAARPSPDR